MTPAAAVERIWTALGGGPLPAPVRWTGPAGTLPSPLPVATLAQATVAACALAAARWRAATGHPVPGVPVDAGNVATAFTSERVLRRDGHGFSGFAPLSRFWPAADGWVRTHANYPHHHRRLLDVLGVGTDDAAGPAIARRSATELEEAAALAGALAFAVRTPAQWRAHPQGSAVAGLPLLTLDQVGDAAPVPAPTRPRVLDLTRVIAGPVGTRTLALLGADVLRVDDPGLPEIGAQHLDTGFGKRSTLLDLRHAADRRTFEELLASADVVVTGYRPGALDAYGLDAGALHERRPDLVVARLSGWGRVGPWAGRRGFDSLVQAATGIAALCAAGGADGTGDRGPGDSTPGALPAQALDHGTGYLLAAAVLRALAARQGTGGGWLADLSLAQTAHWLLDLPARPSTVEDAIEDAVEGAAADPPDADEWTAELDGLRYALPPVRVPGCPRTWAHGPREWGGDPPEWTA